jgi:hypothetical protein
MSCIVVTAGEHQLSVPKLLEATMGHSPLTAADVDALKSITTRFKDITITVDGGVATAHYLDQTTTKTSTLVGWAEKIWHDSFPGQYAAIEASEYNLTNLREALAAAGY